MQHNTIQPSALSAGVSVSQDWVCMQKAACSPWNLQGVLVNGTEPVLLMMPVKRESISSYGRSPRKQNKTNPSTHRSCCAQRKMVHLLCQGAHHVCWLHWHRMVHCRRDHSTLEAHTVSIWKHVPQGRKRSKQINTVTCVNIQCVYFLMKRLNSTMYNFYNHPCHFLFMWIYSISSFFSSNVIYLWCV